MDNCSYAWARCRPSGITRLSVADIFLTVGFVARLGVVAD